MLVLLNKPYGVLSQFTSDGGKWRTLAEFIDTPNVYAAGR
nr:pseudouridine synthase [Kiritimatiellia bacterium]